MKPAFKAFSYRADATPRLACRLLSQNVRSRAIKLRPSGSDVVEWSVGWPAGVVTKTTAPDGGLKMDARTGVLSFPITRADIADLEPGRAVHFVVIVVNGDGARWPFLEGTIVRETTAL